MRILLRNSAAGAGLIALLAFAGPSAAEDLAGALATAYAGNPTLAAARAELRATDEGVPEALSGWRPTISGQVTAGGRWVRPSATVGGLDRNLEPQTYSVTITQPIFDGWATVKGVSAAENQVLAGRAQLAAIEQDVLLKSVAAYMAVERNIAILELTRNNEAVIAQQLQATRDRFAAGEVTKTDVAQAESRLQGAVAARIAAEGQVTVAKAAYRQVIGGEPVDLSLPKLALDLPKTEDEALAAAENAPLLAAARFVAEAAKDGIDVAISALLPKLSISGSWSRSADSFLDRGHQDEGEVLAILTVPLYQAGAPDARVRASKQAYQQSRLGIEEARRAAEQEAISAWQALKTAEAQLQSFQEQERAAELALDGVRQEQAVGARTILDILDAEQELLNARVNRIGAETERIVAAYRLLAAGGRLSARELGLAVEIYDPIAHYEDVRSQFFGIGDPVE